MNAKSLVMICKSGNFSDLAISIFAAAFICAAASNPLVDRGMLIFALSLLTAVALMRYVDLATAVINAQVKIHNVINFKIRHVDLTTIAFDKSKSAQSRANNVIKFDRKAK